MSRRYYRRRNRSSGILGSVILLILLLSTWLYSNSKILTYILIGLGCLAIIILTFFILFKIKKQRNNDQSNDSLSNDLNNISANDIINEPVKYFSKDLLTEAERCFYAVLTEIVGVDFIIQPQINLATIINKESKATFQNELYRNIDFGIFRKSNYELLLLIELNDNSHNDPKRKQRDKKVKDICNEAKIPLIAFWLNMPNTKDYISNRIKPFLKTDLSEISNFI